MYRDQPFGSYQKVYWQQKKSRIFYTLSKTSSEYKVNYFIGIMMGKGINTIEDSL